MKLEVELAPHHKSGLFLRNPVMLAAGPAGYGVEVYKVEILSGLEAFFQAEGIESIEEIIGAALV